MCATHIKEPCTYIGLHNANQKKRIMTAAVGSQSHRAENHPTGLDMATAQFDKVDKDGRDDGTGKIPDLRLCSGYYCPYSEVRLEQEPCVKSSQFQ